tara:strand:+ start:89 stop:286 length:198 start_codon:yes stop_codon:yes gene_type:complete
MSSKTKVIKKPNIKKATNAVPKLSCTSVNKRFTDTISSFNDESRYRDRATEVKQKTSIRVKNLMS